ncbi:MAG: HEAT repeat domain-containing protein [Deltaproteobacteria bacterium]|nr:HEAT repeat domain-containing protein [Deltaproteobacteria bacterium]
MLRFVLTASIISLGTLAAPRAGARPDPVAARPASIRTLLSAIDVVPPDRASLERAYPNARAELISIARDAAESDWTRLRATSLLSFFQDAGTRKVLDELARDARVEVRRIALYTLGRAFGPSDPSVVAPLERAALTDPEAAVREHAVRALRWIDAPAAAGTLTSIRKARPELARLVDTTVERRARRLAAP